jgi:hypothetical protein
MMHSLVLRTQFFNNELWQLSSFDGAMTHEHKEFQSFIKYL